MQLCLSNCEWYTFIWIGLILFYKHLREFGIPHMYWVRLGQINIALVGVKNIQFVQHLRVNSSHDLVSNEE